MTKVSQMITMPDKEHEELVQLLFASRAIIEDYLELAGRKDGRKLLDKIDKVVAREYIRVKNV